VLQNAKFLAYGGGNSVGICHIHDDELSTMVQPLCKVVGRTPGAAKRGDRGFGGNMSFYFSDGLLAATGDERDKRPAGRSSCTSIGSTGTSPPQDGAIDDQGVGAVWRKASLPPSTPPACWGDAESGGPLQAG
jgi:hypothetical protein